MTYEEFQYELEKGYEENRRKIAEIREKFERNIREGKERHQYALMCTDIVMALKDQIDDDEWREWVLLENAACMPISMGKIFKHEKTH